MIIVIVNHIVKSGMMDQALRRINSNGELMSEIPGYIFRYLIRSNENPAKLTTFTAWEQEEDFNRWLTFKRTLNEMDDTGMYESSKRELFTVLKGEV